MNIKVLDAKEICLSDDEISMLAEIEEHPDVRKWVSHVYGGSIEKMHAWFKKSLSELPESGNEFLVAKVDERIVGFVGIHRLSGNMGHVGEVGIMVHPKQHNKGIGTALLKACIGIAKKRGFERLEADTLAHNKAMVRIAEKTGFRLEGIRKRRIKKNNTYFDESSISDKSESSLNTVLYEVLKCLIENICIWKLMFYPFFLRRDLSPK